jgi:hypothetical protein
VGSLATTLAVLTAAIGGGSYQGRVDAPCDSHCVARLFVVDDGRSLTARSIVAAPCNLAETPDADSKPAPRGTPVNTDGSFRWHTRFQVVEGRFAADGRSVSGTSRFRDRARSDCSSATTTFTALLAHRAKADGTCEPLSKGRLAVSVFVRPKGCTDATRVVDAWRADRDCVTTSLDLRSCRVAGRRCVPVLGGRLARLAGVACRSGRSQIELVIRRDCPGVVFGPGPMGADVRAINVGCPGAGSVARRWAQRSGCRARSCTVAAWRCRRPAGILSTTRCRRGHAAVEIRPRRFIVESS